MATAGAYTSTEIKFHRQYDTADVSKVRRPFLHESENFLEDCRYIARPVAVLIIARCSGFIPTWFLIELIVLKY